VKSTSNAGGKLNQTSEDAEDDKYTSENNDAADEKYTTE